jgi:hypothetical protein
MPPPCHGGEFFLFLTLFTNILKIIHPGFYFHGVTLLVTLCRVARQDYAVAFRVVRQDYAVALLHAAR